MQGCALLWVLLWAGCDETAEDVERAVTEEMVESTYRGVTRDGCERDAECGLGAVCPPAYGYCVRPCRSDADCGAPKRCLLDRLEIDFCGCEGPGCAAGQTQF